ncbi:DnaJ domain-containing protein [Roseibium aestuarii]|uniref:DnaJ domain-containing protein n=1 Tax=Roseibium aestuarii TaxID=2600299 RepID=A0ABW4JZB3_9HYPH|nr:DnaJ domain-containing protein [Roseibium aestuarii]
MIYFLAGLGLFAVLILCAQRFVRANPADLARGLKLVAGIVCLVAAAGLGIAGRLVLALPLGAFGLSLLGLSRLSRGTAGRAGQPRGGQVSRVRSALVEMELDHDTGRIGGGVLAGELSGRDLDSLSRDELEALWRMAQADAQSLSLVEAYLDRRLAGWRVDFEADGADRERGPSRPGAMTDQEAYEVLGLAPGAGDAEIRAAFHRLMKRMHPDRGGSAFLAAKLNEAKDRLLGRH